MKTCLVVDNSKMIRRVASRILSEMRFNAEEAENGLEALNFCRGKMPEAILLDWNMPVMDGLTFVKTLRQEPGGKSPVIVFCTSERDVIRISEALNAGANEYIMKPFDSDIIASKFLQAGLLG